MPIETITYQNGRIKIIDQTKLPLELIYLLISDYRELCDAIKQLKIRGAPAIGIAGAFGVVLGLQDFQDTGDKTGFLNQGERIISEIASTRPTAVNLFWALDRMKKKLFTNQKKPISQIKQLLLQEATRIMEQDKAICRTIGRNGATLLGDDVTVLTHCNAGALATADFGTALGVIYTAAALGKRVHVVIDETRPLLQGARLTTWELMQAQIDVTLICDNMAAFMMQQGRINCIMVGADRIASNGDAANKIGTYNLAVLAHYHHIPFYIIAPTSTIDQTLENGTAIPVEERSPIEVSEGLGKRIAPLGVKIYNPAFDITPYRLITAIVTERGIYYPPYKEKLKKCLI